MALRTDPNWDCLVQDLQTSLSETRLDSLNTHTHTHTHTLLPQVNSKPTIPVFGGRPAADVGIPFVTCNLSNTEPSGPFERWLQQDSIIFEGD
jgi:hypothetical protein